MPEHEDGVEEHEEVSAEQQQHVRGDGAGADVAVAAPRVGQHGQPRPRLLCVDRQRGLHQPLLPGQGQVVRQLKLHAAALGNQQRCKRNFAKVFTIKQDQKTFI